MTKFNCPEVTLCSWQDVTIPLLTNCHWFVELCWVVTLSELAVCHILFSTRGSGAGSTMAPSSVSMVTSVVQWIFLLETWRNRSLSFVSVTLKISRIMCIFLAGQSTAVISGDHFICMLVNPICCVVWRNCLRIFVDFHVVFFCVYLKNLWRGMGGLFSIYLFLKSRSL